jgi:ATP-dependent Clp protease ATP-binding subunit ClpA
MGSPLISSDVEASFRQAVTDAKGRRHEFVTVEHLLLALTRNQKTQAVLVACGAEVNRLRERLEAFLSDKVKPLKGIRPGRFTPGIFGARPRQDLGIERVLQRAAIRALETGQGAIEGGDVLAAMLRERESHALLFLQQEGLTHEGVLEQLSLAGESPRVVTQVKVARDVWVSLVRYRRERKQQLEREVSTSEAMEELLRKALALEAPAPATPADE